jgi:hypothetical protein
MFIRSSKTEIRSVVENNKIRKQNCGLFQGTKTITLDRLRKMHEVGCMNDSFLQVSDCLFEY